MALVNVTWVGSAISLRVAGAAHVLDALGDLLGPVVRRGHTIVDSARCLEREEN